MNSFFKFLLNREPSDLSIDDAAAKNVAPLSTPFDLFARDKVGNVFVGKVLPALPADSEPEVCPDNLERLGHNGELTELLNTPNNMGKDLLESQAPAVSEPDSARGLQFPGDMELTKLSTLKTSENEKGFQSTAFLAPLEVPG